VRKHKGKKNFFSQFFLSFSLRKVSVDVGSAKGDQALVRILAAPINPADINQVQGTYAVLPPLPAVGGNEGVGVVEAVGDAVKGLAVGDHVIMGDAGLGTWRTRGLFPAASLISVPKDLSVEHAATIGVNAATAYRLLADFVPLQKGDTVLANAGSSGVVSALAALCHVRGVRLVLSMRARPDWDVLVERLKQQGAEAVVDEEFVRTPAFKKLLSDMPPPKLALNAVGGRSATELARHLARGGTLVTYGGMSRQPVTLPTSLLIFKDIVARGFWMTQWNKTASAAAKKAMLTELFGLAKAGQLKSYVERHELDNFADAFKRVQEGQVSRKVLLTLNKK
jgi:trans-2-enoyl-CoA reductase